MLASSRKPQSRARTVRRAARLPFARALVGFVPDPPDDVNDPLSMRPRIETTFFPAPVAVMVLVRKEADARDALIDLLTLARDTAQNFGCDTGRWMHEEEEERTRDGQGVEFDAGPDPGNGWYARGPLPTRGRMIERAKTMPCVKCVAYYTSAGKPTIRTVSHFWPPAVTGNVVAMIREGTSRDRAVAELCEAAARLAATLS